MRNLLLSIAVIAGLILLIGVAHAQSTATVTATCKDGTAFTGTKRAGACRGHGGVQSWGEAASPANALSQPGAQPAPTTTQRATPAPGGPGQIWVNTASKDGGRRVTSAECINPAISVFLGSGSSSTVEPSR